jgi:hypothetical protein
VRESPPYTRVARAYCAGSELGVNFRVCRALYKLRAAQVGAERTARVCRANAWPDSHFVLIRFPTAGSPDVSCAEQLERFKKHDSPSSVACVLACI